MASFYYCYSVSLNNKHYHVEICEDRLRVRDLYVVEGGHEVKSRNVLWAIAFFLKVFFRSGKETNAVVQYKGGYNSGGVTWGDDDVHHLDPAYE